MTELAKYVGPDLDSPWMGMGVCDKELGYMFGQYKRINVKTTVAGKPFLQGGPTFSHVSIVDRMYCNTVLYIFTCICILTLHYTIIIQYTGPRLWSGAFCQ